MQRSQNNSQRILRNCSVKNKFSFLWCFSLLSLYLRLCVCLSCISSANAWIACCAKHENWIFLADPQPRLACQGYREGGGGVALSALEPGTGAVNGKSSALLLLLLLLWHSECQQIVIREETSIEQGGGEGRRGKGVEGVWFWVERRQSAECSWNSNSSGKVDIEMVTGYRESCKMGTETDRQKRRRKEGVRGGGRKRF